MKIIEFNSINGFNSENYSTLQVTAKNVEWFTCMYNNSESTILNVLHEGPMVAGFAQWIWCKIDLYYKVTLSNNGIVKQASKAPTAPISKASHAISWKLIISDIWFKESFLNKLT